MKHNVMFIAILFLCSNLFIGSSCKKNKSSATTEDQLPAATQTGANTFGCLVNGKVFVNKGYTNPYPNYRVIIDPGANNNFDLRTYSYQNNIETDFGFSSFGVNGIGNYIINGVSQIYPYYTRDGNSNICYFVSSNNNFKQGYLKITRYDLQNGIISGEFEMKLFDAQISCDTIRITQGRFDKKN